MSDFTVNATCSVCGIRFPMDDGVPCSCHEEIDEENQDQREIEMLVVDLIGALIQWPTLAYRGNQ